MSTDNPLSVLQGTFFFRIVDQAFTRSKYKYAIQHNATQCYWYGVGLLEGLLYP